MSQRKIPTSHAMNLADTLRDILRKLEYAPIDKRDALKMLLRDFTN